jgi:ribosomal protein S18 acetylase RimI-like enzyme
MMPLAACSPMEILDLRHLRSRDLEPLLEEERVLWERDLAWDYTASAGLIKRYVDASALSGYAAVEDGKTVGYAFYLYENRKGVVGDAFVRESPSATATEAELLTHVIETLQGTPGIRRIEAQLMTLRHQPSDAFFSSRAIRCYRRQFMLLPMASNGHSPSRSVPGIVLKTWDPQWTTEAANLIARSYSNHIDSYISDQYRTQAGALRFLDNIVHYPGCGEFAPLCSFLAFHKELGRLCGMVLSSVVAPGVYHITQICVDPEIQKSGIGKMLLMHNLEKLRQLRARAVTLTVTNDNFSATSLYRQLGFVTLKEFNALAWEAGAE